MGWRPGDPCRLVNLREGKVYDDGVIDTVKGDKVTVLAGGARWFVQLPSSFLQKRPEVFHSVRSEDPQDG